MVFDCYWNQLPNLLTSWSISVEYTACKLFKCGVLPGPYFLHFSGPYFPVFGPNMEMYSVNLRIQPKFRKIRTRKNSLFGHFSRSDMKIKKTLFLSPIYPLTNTITYRQKVFIYLKVTSLWNLKETCVDFFPILPLTMSFYVIF